MVAEIVVTTREGHERRLALEPGLTLMEAIRDEGIDDCWRCVAAAARAPRVTFTWIPEFADRLPPVSADEDDLLDSSDHRTLLSRLSCQIRLSGELDGLRVTIAADD